MKGIQVDGTSFSIGAAAGAIAAGVAAYLLCRRHFDGALDVETAKVKAHYQAKGFAAVRAYYQANDYADVEAAKPHVGWPESVDVLGVEGQGVDEISFEFTKGNDLTIVSDIAGIDPEISGDAASGLAPAWPPASRDRSKPYVISVGEFAENCDEIHQQVTITYYLGDNVLVDEQDTPIRDIAGTTGRLSPSGFGGVSGDPNIRFVRNERLQLDFEICLDRRSYVDAILNYGNPNRPRDE